MNHQLSAISYQLNTINPQLPKFLHRFFWEYDPEKIEKDKHADLIKSRIMERGSWQAMVWLKSAYSDAELMDFLCRKGKKILPLRELNYWAMVSGVSDEMRKKWLKDAMKEKNIWKERNAH